MSTLRFTGVTCDEGQRAPCRNVVSLAPYCGHFAFVRHGGTCDAGVRWMPWSFRPRTRDHRRHCVRSTIGEYVTDARIRRRLSKDRRE